MRSPAAKRRTSRATEANMTPMIDVVFLLIIFFLVSSHLARRETRLALDLPSAATGEPDNDPSPRLTINIEADGTLSLGPTPVEADELMAKLAEAKSERGESLRVRLRGDQATPYAAIEPALAACAKAGVEDISLAVFAERAGGAR